MIYFEKWLSMITLCTTQKSSIEYNISIFIQSKWILLKYISFQQLKCFIEINENEIAMTLILNLVFYKEEKNIIMCKIPSHTLCYLIIFYCRSLYTIVQMWFNLNISSASVFKNLVFFSKYVINIYKTTIVCVLPSSMNQINLNLNCF